MLKPCGSEVEISKMIEKWVYGSLVVKHLLNVKSEIHLLVSYRFLFRFSQIKMISVSV